jgi:hypothetical protein
MMSLCLLRFAAILERTSSAVKTAGISVYAGFVGSIGTIGAGLAGGGGSNPVVSTDGAIVGSLTALLALLVLAKIAMMAVDWQQRAAADVAVMSCAPAI